MNAPIGTKIKSQKVLLFNPTEGSYNEANQFVPASSKGLLMLSLKRVKLLNEILKEYPTCLEDYINARATEEVKDAETTEIAQPGQTEIV